MLLRIAEFGCQAPERRKNAGEFRYHNSGNAEFAGQGHGVHGTCPAEGNQRTGACIETALNGNPTQSPGHVGVGNLIDTKCRLLDGKVKSLRDCPDRSQGKLRIEPNTITQQLLAIEIAQHEVGISDRRLMAAEAITGRPWVGPGTVRANPNRLTLNAGD